MLPRNHGQFLISTFGPNYQLVVRLYDLIVTFSCSHLLHTFCTAKTCHLRCYAYNRSCPSQTSFPFTWHRKWSKPHSPDRACLPCVGVGLVSWPHLLFGGVHSVTTYPRGSGRAARTAWDWWRIKREGSWMEWRTQSRRVTLTSYAWMRWHKHANILSHAMCERQWVRQTETEQGLRRLTLRAHSRVHQVCHVIVGFHVLCVDLGFHVVIGVGRLTIQREDFIRQT